LDLCDVLDGRVHAGTATRLGAGSASPPGKRGPELALELDLDADPAAGALQFEPPSIEWS
jgi:hypothetical protein